MKCLMNPYLINFVETQLSFESLSLLGLGSYHIITQLS